jgi:hypothetical protein
MELSLYLKGWDARHDDLILQFAGKTWCCDSYYLALDNTLLPGREDTEKVRVVLKRLIEQWLEAAENLRDGGVIYLPYDFSDEWIGCLRCSRSGDNVTVSHGRSSMNGFSVIPSAVGQYMTDMIGFRPDEPTVQGDIEELIESIRSINRG